jgi:hypothetical protein
MHRVARRACLCSDNGRISGHQVGLAAQEPLLQADRRQQKVAVVGTRIVNLVVQSELPLPDLLVRQVIRESVNFDSLDPPSRRVFFDVIAPRISMLVVGPPIERGRQWLALMRAGLLKVDLGPSPEVHRDYARRTWRAQSTRFDKAVLRLPEGRGKASSFHFAKE